jgi:hypothetical protein
MKTINTIAIAIAVLMLGWPFKGTAQVTQFFTLYAATTNLPVQPNQIVSVVGYDWVDRPSLSGNLPDGTVINLTPVSSKIILGSSSAETISSQIPQIATGLTNVTLSAFSGWATFQITTPASANVVSNYVPADAIVIPASATGNVQIILESSPDLVNWTAASPGTYGASAGTNRFFRVRAAAN